MITATIPEVAESGRYSVSQTAEALEISRKTLWAHTGAGLIKHGTRKSNGRKFYLGSEILKYWKAQY